MTGPDDDALVPALRARLDAELGSVHADRRVLAGVLAQPVRRRSWKGWAAVAGAGSVLAGVAAVAVVGLPSSHGPTTVQLGSDASPSEVPSTAPSAVPSTQPTVRPTVPPPASTPPSAAGCPAQTSDPGGAVLQVDLDGDGVDDALSWNGGAFHVVLGAGHGEVSSGFTTASPYITALPVTTAGAARRQVLIGTRGRISLQGSVGTVARLYDLRACAFTPVLGTNGEPYDFLVGSASDTERSGVLCDGNVLYGRTAVLQGGSWHVTDRPVTSAEGTAVNGPPRTSAVAAGTPEADALATETCGRTPVPLD